MTKPMNKIEKLTPLDKTTNTSNKGGGNYLMGLIEEICPDGVEFRALGEVADYVRGLTYSKKDEVQSGEGLKVLRSNNISLSTNTLNFDDVKIVSTNVKVRENQRLIQDDILISAASGSKAHVGKVAYITKDLDYCFGGFMAVIRTNTVISSRFLFHLLVGENFSKYLERSLSTTTINNLSASIMNAFQIPIPPLTIQKEIVKILDNFTRLEAELEAELEARKKQYEYYRDELLTFGDDVEFRALGDVCDVFTGGETPANSIKGYNPSKVCKYPIFGNGVEVYGYADTYRIDKDAVTISSIGANTGTVYFRKAFFTPIIRLKVVLPIKENLLSKYLFYYLSSIKIYSKKSSVPNMNANDVKKIKIPIPPLAIQEETAAILDKFDALVNDISTGLPAEITARKKQYEHYRNQLLTFKPLELQDAN